MLTKRIKIVRSVTVPQSLGFCREVMIKLRDMGCEMVAVTSPGPELDSLRDDGFHCVEVPMQRHISFLKDLKSLVLMIKVLHREKPQVVHSMTPKAGLVSMMAAWMTRVPVRIHTFTGLVWPTTTGIKRWLLKVTDWLTCVCATHIIPEGQGVLNDLRNGGITKKPMKVLGYGNVKGVDMERFDPTRFEVNKSGKFSFLFVGRIVADKGINELVEAFVKLNSEYPDTCLNLVGSYEENLDPIKSETARIISENSCVVAEGPQYGDNLLLEYVNCDCFVFPSYREGFPNTVLEAGAMGLPCIVTDINGSREIIENGKNGLIVQSKDVAELYQAMKYMLIDTNARKRMAECARPMILSRFEKNFVQQCLIDYYREIVPGFQSG